MKADSLPLYEEIARDLIEAIDRGAHPIGSLMPTEFELADRYKVSRQTVRMAMRRLSEIGAVSRRPGAGTRVEARGPSDGGFQQTLTSIGDLTALAAATIRDEQGIEPVVMDRAMARLFGCPPGSRWLKLAYVRRPANPAARPLAWVDVHLDERYGAVLDGMRDDPGLVSDRVERRFGLVVSEVRQEVSAVALGAAHALALEADAGTPALQVLRRYFDQRGSLFEISVSTHPAGRYTVNSTLKRVRSTASEA